MLKLTRKTEYALIALRHLTETTGRGVASTRQIAERYHLPPTLLAKILQELARNGIVEPVQGSRGGYSVKANLSRISLTRFMETLEGPLGIMDCAHDSGCELLSLCNIRAPIRKINATLKTVFDKMSVSEVIQ